MAKGVRESPVLAALTVRPALCASQRSMIIPRRSPVMKKTLHLRLVQTDGRKLVNLPHTHPRYLLHVAHRIAVADWGT